MALSVAARTNGDGRQMASSGRHEFVLDNGNKFYIRRYDAFLSLRVLGEVQKRFLSPLAALMEVRDDKISDESRMAAMFDALEKISKGLDGEQLVSLVKTILNPDFVSVSIDGEPPQQVNEGTLNLAIGDMADVVALVIEVIKVNYTELFMRGRTLIGQASSVTANP